MTLPHVNSDDPIGFLVQFNIYMGLKTALLYSITTTLLISLISEIAQGCQGGINRTSKI